MKAVILAGGKGTRLAPYTKILPKALMPIGEIPILEVLLRQIKRAGVESVILTVGHMAELLRAFFEDGQRFGLKIDYSFEDQPLGTAGPLSLVTEQLQETFLVCNADVLTNLNLLELVGDHRRSGAAATIACHQRQVHVDLGVLQFDNNDDLTGYIEKPSYNFSVSMGIYVFEPRILNHIPYNNYLDFPDLVLKLIAAGERVRGFRFDGYWQDLGRKDDYEQAVKDFETLRTSILGEGD